MLGDFRGGRGFLLLAIYCEVHRDQRRRRRHRGVWLRARASHRICGRPCRDAAARGDSSAGSRAGPGHDGTCAVHLFAARAERRRDEPAGRARCRACRSSATRPQPDGNSPAATAALPPLRATVSTAPAEPVHKVVKTEPVKTEPSPAESKPRDAAAAKPETTPRDAAEAKLESKPDPKPDSIEARVRARSANADAHRQAPADAHPVVAPGPAIATPVINAPPRPAENSVMRDAVATPPRTPILRRARAADIAPQAGTTSAAADRALSSGRNQIAAGCRRRRSGRSGRSGCAGGSQDRGQEPVLGVLEILAHRYVAAADRYPASADAGWAVGRELNRIIVWMSDGFRESSTHPTGVRG